MSTLLSTRNAEWGFFGTMRQLGSPDAEPDAAWTLASGAVARATGAAPAAVRDFLDSRHGRHLADDVANGLARGRELEAAIDAAVARWMAWIVDRRIACEAGIPRGLPYLMALVALFEMPGGPDP